MHECATPIKQIAKYMCQFCFIRNIIICRLYIFSEDQSTNIPGSFSRSNKRVICYDRWPRKYVNPRPACVRHDLRPTIVHTTTQPSATDITVQGDTSEDYSLMYTVCQWHNRYFLNSVIPGGSSQVMQRKLQTEQKSIAIQDMSVLHRTSSLVHSISAPTATLYWCKTGIIRELISNQVSVFFSSYFN